MKVKFGLCRFNCEWVNRMSTDTKGFKLKEAICYYCNDIYRVLDCHGISKSIKFRSLSDNKDEFEDNYCFVCQECYQKHAKNKEQTIRIP
jgi:hypothetical protein